MTECNKYDSMKTQKNRWQVIYKDKSEQQLAESISVHNVIYNFNLVNCNLIYKTS